VGTLATVYVLLSVLSFLPDPWWLVSLTLIAPVGIANVWARRANALIDPARVENASFTSGNRIALAIGVPLGILAIIGTFTGAQ
jgi:hypothetical protein